MHDARELLTLGDKGVARLARRGYALRLEELESLHRERTETAAELDLARSELKRSAKSREAATAERRAAARLLRERVQRAEARFREARERLTGLLTAVPNIPLDEVPEGRTEAEAVEVRRCGPPPAPADESRHHAAVGAELGILDAERAAKLSGARFSVARGAGARLERALAAFFLDLHTGTHGYTEYSVPYLVTRETMTGTGQLPKFEEDLFATRVGDRELMLIPTAEVPLTNLFAGEVIDAARLPLAVTAHTPCFRAEAGSYGRDSRGVLRLHQFEKVELVRLCAPDDARRELELMVTHVEACLRALELSYRVVLLPAGDLGFSARMTYDLEVWLPGGGAFREISSVSDCGGFQARRAGIRHGGPGSRKAPVVTLNGSALPIGRTVAAILEQHVRPDGSVQLPEALVPYAGFARILPGGATTA
ncbi:seryl-tRNA synthetase [Streptomyces viridochromogenes]|uniref:Serine--tRNA ligase n=1 Tax=Streptomyces viridochromogenes TaxID=1938 RepID=A0A0J8C3H3_STRVR|nr:serine--tRNA ligase [Streptomyces viridochromogenes]KMS72355.1 seryl-tRNA synthetase [Streptomyces viridochromogenes]